MSLKMKVGAKKISKIKLTKRIYAIFSSEKLILQR